jgi:hypothetical protein
MTWLKLHRLADSVPAEVPGIGPLFRQLGLGACPTPQHACDGGECAPCPVHPHLRSLLSVVSMPWWDQHITAETLRALPPVCPENLKLFISLTFFEFLFMLEQWTPPSSDMSL